MSETPRQLGTHGETVMWEPSRAEAASSRRGIQLETYRDGLEWSIDSLPDFWDSLRDLFDVLGDGFDGPVLAADHMPGASWYPDAKVNYAENILRHALDPALRKATAILHVEEDGSSTALSWSELRRRVGGFARSFQPLGVTSGDRVVAVLPNIPEAIIGLLASASSGVRLPTSTYSWPWHQSLHPAALPDRHRAGPPLRGWHNPQPRQCSRCPANRGPGGVVLPRT